ncbi:MAG TPA: hypothetical protein VIQ31_39745 [Phormidium sp.]
MSSRLLFPSDRLVHNLNHKPYLIARSLTFNNQKYLTFATLLH